nr:MAG TPA_asm: hypothetical protein [Caudoviricetes sp.]
MSVYASFKSVTYLFTPVFIFHIHIPNINSCIYLFL